MTVLALQKHDRLPVSTLKSPIDAIRLGFHFGEQVMVAFDMGTAGGPDLNKSKFPLIAGIFFEEPLNRQEALENTLCIVHAIDATPHERSLNAQIAQQSGTIAMLGAILVDVIFRGVVIGEGNADRKRPDEGSVFLAERGKVFPINA